MIFHSTVSTTLAIMAMSHSALASSHYPNTTVHTIAHSNKILDCGDDGNVAFPYITYGNSTGQEFCMSQVRPTQGNKLISEIWTYSDDNQVWGLKVHFGDDTAMEIGTKGNKTELTITPFKIEPQGIQRFFTSPYDPGNTLNIVGLGFQLADNTITYVGNTTTAWKPAYYYGNATLLGIAGRHGANGIEQLFMYLNGTVSAL